GLATDVLVADFSPHVQDISSVHILLCERFGHIYRTNLFVPLIGIKWLQRASRFILETARIPALIFIGRRTAKVEIYGHGHEVRRVFYSIISDSYPAPYLPVRLMIQTEIGEAY